MDTNTNTTHAVLHSLPYVLGLNICAIFFQFLLYREHIFVFLKKEKKINKSQLNKDWKININFRCGTDRAIVLPYNFYINILGKLVYFFIKGFSTFKLFVCNPMNHINKTFIWIKNAWLLFHLKGFKILKNV